MCVLERHGGVMYAMSVFLMCHWGSSALLWRLMPLFECSFSNHSCVCVSAHVCVCVSAHVCVSLLPSLSAVEFCTASLHHAPPRLGMPEGQREREGKRERGI